MTVEEAGAALQLWGDRIDAARKRGPMSRALDRLEATRANLVRIHAAVHRTTPKPALERFLLRTTKFVEEAGRVVGESTAGQTEAPRPPG